MTATPGARPGTSQPSLEPAGGRQFGPFLDFAVLLALAHLVDCGDLVRDWIDIS